MTQVTLEYLVIKEEVDLEKFWIIWRDDAHSVAEKMYDEEKAEEDLKWFVKENPGVTFHLMELKESLSSDE